MTDNSSPIYRPEPRHYDSESLGRYIQQLTLHDTEKLLSKDYFSDKPLTVQRKENGIILPGLKSSDPKVWFYGGVTTDAGEYISISSQIADGMIQRVEGAYDFNRDKLHRVDEEVIYMGCFFSRHWGHFLMDMTGRLWYAAKNTGLKVAYTVPTGQKLTLSGNYLEFVELAGVSSDRLIRIDTPTSFKAVFVPESSIIPARYFTKEHREMFDRIVANSGASFSREEKIYCSRGKFRKAVRSETGEKYIEQVFNDNGYNSVSMEQMTLRDQIKALNSSGEIAMLSGTLPHNVLFLRNGAEVTIINKFYGRNEHQLLANQLSGVSVTYVDAYVSPLPVEAGPGPFIIRITQDFRNYCRDKGLKISESAGKLPSEKLSISTKIWYYTKWITAYILNKRNIFYLGTFQWGKIFKRIRASFSETLGYRLHGEIKDFYASQQSGK